MKNASVVEPISYRDLELEIGPGADGRYPVAVLRSPSGQARAVMAFPFGHDALQAELAALEDAILGFADQPQQVAEAFGARLFQALICDAVQLVYERSLQAVAEQGEGLRIKLRVNAPELTTVPWEFLYDPQQGEFLTLSRNTPVVRYLEVPRDDQDLSVRPPLRILGMLASPTDAVPLDLEQERARLEAALEPLRDQGKVELVWLEGQTWRDLQAAMQQGPWHVFHFVGHAAPDSSTGRGVLLLADEQGNSSPLTAEQLGRLLGDHATLRLAVLNACQGARGSEQGLFSSTAATLVERGLPAVLAMQYEITDRAALQFTSSFYGALAANLPIDAAVSEARKALSLELPRSLEWGTPVLYMRAPDGVLWDVKPRRSLPLPVMVGAAVAVVAVLALLLFIAFRSDQVARAVNQPAPTPTPAEMSGQFRVAVADFGTVDPLTGQVRESAEGRLLSGWLARGLENMRKTRDEPLLGQVEVWQNTLDETRQNFELSFVPGEDEDARQAAAAALADRIKAHMVIYGNVVFENTGASLDLDFYLSSQLQDEGRLIVGPHALGGPLLLPVPFDPDEDFPASIEVGRRLGGRAEAIFWLIIGLTYDQLGDSEAALAALREGEARLARQDDPTGRALLSYFQGRQHFFLAQQDATAMREAAQAGRLDEAEASKAAAFDRLDAAAESFQHAVAIDPDYVRARTALASTMRKRAELTLPAPDQVLDQADAVSEVQGLLKDAILTQQKAVEDAQRAADDLNEAAARIALAKSYDQLGEVHYLINEYDLADPLFAQAVDEAQQALGLLAGSSQSRLLAQAQEAAGAAHRLVAAGLWERGRLDEARLALESSIAAYEACEATGVDGQLDEILQDTVIAAGCRPNLEATRRALEDLKEAQS